MASHPSLSKIQPEHLDRDAVIYVRQSSLIQVRDNTASTMRQYDLVQRALSLGWPRERIQIIDQDQGHSGSSTIGRDGFQFAADSFRSSRLEVPGVQLRRPAGQEQEQASFRLAERPASCREPACRCPEQCG